MRYGLYTVCYIAKRHVRVCLYGVSLCSCVYNICYDNIAIAHLIYTHTIQAEPNKNESATSQVRTHSVRP